MNSGDTAWVLASSALVLLMTPGLEASGIDEAEHAESAYELDGFGGRGSPAGRSVTGEHTVQGSTA